jgi:hypothetical protein
MTSGLYRFSSSKNACISLTKARATAGGRSILATVVAHELGVGLGSLFSFRFSPMVVLAIGIEHALNVPIES